jgi:hypothetical protein
MTKAHANPRGTSLAQTLKRTLTELLIAGIASALWTASGYVGAFMRAAVVVMISPLNFAAPNAKLVGFKTIMPGAVLA